MDTEPDGYAVIHSRMTDTLYFGPFATLKEVTEWQKKIGDKMLVRGYIVPLFKDVDWNRKG